MEIIENVIGSDLVARRSHSQTVSDSVENQYFIKNHLGSTVALISKEGTPAGPVFDYFPYGKQKEEVVTPEKITQTFTGKEFDLFEQDTTSGDDGEGWYYFGARYYDADVGLWTSCDPAGQFWNAYSYALNPVNQIDPNGFEVEPVDFESSVSWINALFDETMNVMNGEDAGNFTRMTNLLLSSDMYFYHFSNNVSDMYNWVSGIDAGYSQGMQDVGEEGRYFGNLGGENHIWATTSRGIMFHELHHAYMHNLGITSYFNGVPTNMLIWEEVGAFSVQLKQDHGQAYSRWKQLDPFQKAQALPQQYQNMQYK